PDPPLPVELRIRERSHEPADDGLGFAQPADTGERGIGLHLHLDPSCQIAELLSELAEDVLDTPLDGPLLALQGSRRRGSVVSTGIRHYARRGASPIVCARELRPLELPGRNLPPGLGCAGEAGARSAACGTPSATNCSRRGASPPFRNLPPGLGCAGEAGTRSAACGTPSATNSRRSPGARSCRGRPADSISR